MTVPGAYRLMREDNGLFTVTNQSYLKGAEKLKSMGEEILGFRVELKKFGADGDIDIVTNLRHVEVKAGNRINNMWSNAQTPGGAEQRDLALDQLLKELDATPSSKIMTIMKPAEKTIDPEFLEKLRKSPFDSIAIIDLD